MITLNVYYKFDKKGEREKYLKALYENGCVQGSRQEVGNHKYDYYFSESSDLEMLLVEHWESASALDAHSQTPHFKLLPGIKSDFNVEVKVERYE
ncbi:MAG: putative quinol monooxygenase [Eubacteriales bacterium]|nr:putative quinol monooxygenase [Eubacteriales bacterium]